MMEAPRRDSEGECVANASALGASTDAAPPPPIRTLSGGGSRTRAVRAVGRSGSSQFDRRAGDE